MNKEMFSFSPSNTKSIALVKLSSEALLCIDEYAKKGALAGLKPTIQIKDGQGIIRIPGMNNMESFSFSLTDIDGNGSPGSLQCFEKPLNGEMRCLGNVETKMQIHAKNASIAHTKSKIEAHDEKQKKTGAKVIKSACSSEAASSQAVGQTNHAESSASAPRERKKAVPLLKKLLSRNFLRGLRSGHSAVSRTAPSSTSQRAAVLLAEPPPIITSKEQKIVEMRKKRVLEDSSTETYSDPRIKKQRISHCSQAEVPPVNKANNTSCPTVTTAVTAAPAIKTQPQERKKRKRTSLDIKIEAISSNTESPNPIAYDLSIVKSEKGVSAPTDNRQCQESKKKIPLSNQNELSAGGKVSPNVQMPSIVKSEKVVSVPADNRQCQESKKKIPLSNQKESSSGGKVSPKVQMPSRSKSTAVKPGDKLSFQEAKELRRKNKNRRRRKRQKLKKRAQRRAASLQYAASRNQRSHENQLPKNPIATPATDIKIEDQTELCKRIELLPVKIKKEDSIKLENQHSFTSDTTNPCHKKIKVEQDHQNNLSFAVEEDCGINKLNFTPPKMSDEDPNFKQKESSVLHKKNLAPKEEFVYTNLEVTSTKLRDNNLQNLNIKQKDSSFLYQKNFTSKDEFVDAMLEVTSTKLNDSNLQGPSLKQKDSSVLYQKSLVSKEEFDDTKLEVNSTKMSNNHFQVSSLKQNNSSLAYQKNIACKEEFVDTNLEVTSKLRDINSQNPHLKQKDSSILFQKNLESKEEFVNTKVKVTSTKLSDRDSQGLNLPKNLALNEEFVDSNLEVTSTKLSDSNLQNPILKPKVSSVLYRKDFISEDEFVDTKLEVTSTKLSDSNSQGPSLQQKDSSVLYQKSLVSKEKFVDTKLEVNSTKLNDRNSQDLNLPKNLESKEFVDTKLVQDPKFTQTDSKHEGVKKEDDFPKTLTKSSDDFEGSALDVLPSKSVERGPLPDLVQHCERIVILDDSHKKDCIIPSVTNEKMEMHPAVSETVIKPISFGTTTIPEASQCCSKNSVLCCNHSFNQATCVNGCEVTSTTKRGQTPTPKPTASTSKENKSAAVMTSTCSKSAIPEEMKEFEEITTLEQRQVYKTVFDEKFEEYKSLQDDLSIYEKYLQSLQHTAKMYSKGSDEYEKVKSKFCESFSYHKKRIEEYAALHTKLERIKDLVMRFDSAQT